MSRAKEFLNSYKQTLDKRRQLNYEAEKFVVKNPQTNIEKNTLSQDSIIRHFSQLKSETTSTMDQIESLFLSKIREFEELKQQIAAEKRTLEELYHIKISTKSLSKIVTILDQKKNELHLISAEKHKQEEEIKTAKLAWQMERKNTEDRIFELEKKEQALANQIRNLDQNALLKEDEKRKELDKRLQERKEEWEKEFQARKQEEELRFKERQRAAEEAIQEKLIKAEKIYFEKETAFSDKEMHVSKLEAEIATFPDKLKREVIMRERVLSEKLMTKYGHIIDMTKNEHESEKKLLRQRQDILTEAIAKKDTIIEQLEARINKLEDKLNISESKTQQLVINAVEKVNQTIAKKPTHLMFDQKTVSTGNSFPKIIRSVKGRAVG